MITSEEYHLLKENNGQRPPGLLSNGHQSEVLRNADSPIPALHFLQSPPTDTEHRTKKREFKCDQCKYLTNRKNNLNRHIAKMHETCDRLLECCGIQFQSKSLFKYHTFNCHKDGYGCAICGRRFFRKALLKRHQTIHSGRKDFVCAECGYGTSNKSNFERHKNIHKKTSQGTALPDVILPLKKRKYAINNCSNTTKARVKGTKTAAPSSVESTKKWPPKSKPPKKSHPENGSENVPANNLQIMIPNTQQVQGNDLPIHFTWPALSAVQSFSQCFPYSSSSFRNEIPVEPPNVHSQGTFYAPICSNTGYSSSQSSSSQSPGGSLESISFQSQSRSDTENFKVGKPRLCASPYKCFNCYQLFSSQTQLACHTQCLHPDTDVVTQSIVNLIKKMNKLDSNAIKSEQLVKKDELQKFLYQK